MFNFWTVAYLLVVGIVGSFIGGFGGYLLFGWYKGRVLLEPSGLIFSILGAIVALLVWRAIRKRASHA